MEQLEILNWAMLGVIREQEYHKALGSEAAEAKIKELDDVLLELGKLIYFEKEKNRKKSIDK